MSQIFRLRRWNFNFDMAAIIENVAFIRLQQSKALRHGNMQGSNGRKTGYHRGHKFKKFLHAIPFGEEFTMVTIWKYNG